MPEPDLLTADNPAASWRESVSEENRGGVAKFETVDALAKSYTELERNMGNKVKIPTPESPAEEISAFYNKLGRPETSEGYKQPELDEGQVFDKEFFGNIASAAHDAGVTDEQFSSLVDKYLGYEAQIKEAELVEFNRYREEADRKLHETYGADYDKNIELSKRAYTEYASDDLKELLDTDKFVGLRNEPAFIDMMVEIGKKNMDDTLIKGDGQPDLPKDDFVPSSPKSPEMYANGDDEYSVKARAYFRRNGFKYGRAD